MILEFLFEFLLEMIFDGSFELGEARQAPAAVRVIAAVVFSVICLGVVGLLVFLSVCSFSWKVPLVAVICIPLAVCFSVFTVAKVTAFFKNN